MEFRIFEKCNALLKESKFTVTLLNDSNKILDALDYHLGSAVAMEISTYKPIDQPWNVHS